MEHSVVSSPLERYDALGLFAGVDWRHRIGDSGLFGGEVYSRVEGGGRSRLEGGHCHPLGDSETQETKYAPRL
jgi:hypothetical protein